MLSQLIQKLCYRSGAGETWRSRVKGEQVIIGSGRGVSFLVKLGWQRTGMVLTTACMASDWASWWKRMKSSPQQKQSHPLVSVATGTGGSLPARLSVRDDVSCRLRGRLLTPPAQSIIQALNNVKHTLNL